MSEVRGTRISSGSWRESSAVLCAYVIPHSHHHLFSDSISVSVVSACSFSLRTPPRRPPFTTTLVPRAGALAEFAALILSSAARETEALLAAMATVGMTVTMAMEVTVLGAMVDVMTVLEVEGANQDMP